MLPLFRVYPHRGCTDVAHFSRKHEVVQGAHGFGSGDGGVEAVDLEQVDVVCSEAFEGGVDGVEEGGAGEACGVGISGMGLVGWGWIGGRGGRRGKIQSQGAMKRGGRWGRKGVTNHLD